jgi:hypothetical protein
MINKLAKLKFLPNNFEIIENGDHVICAISKKKITLRKFELLECRQTGSLLLLCRKQQLNEKKNKYLIFPSIVSPNPLIYVFSKSFFPINH